MTAGTSKIQPLEPASRAYFEVRFGRDLADVRVHTGEAAAAGATAMRSRAYALGRDIYFGANQYAPGTSVGRDLLAHELTHFVQQGGRAPSPGTELVPSRPDDAEEVEARRVTEEIGLGAERINVRRLTAGTHHFMRDFDSTIQICQRVLNSRTFRVENAVVTVDVHATWVPSPDIEGANDQNWLSPGCNDPYFYVSLKKSGWLWDTELSTNPVPVGRSATRTWSGLDKGDYYLMIWTQDHDPRCCLSGTISVTTPSAVPTAGSGVVTVPAGIPSEAAFDGDLLYVSKGGRSFACAALTGTVGDPTPPGRYGVRRQGEAQISGGITGRLFQDRGKWFLLEPQFPTTRSRMQLHPGTMSSGCITVMDHECFDKIAEILNSGTTTTGPGYDGYPPGNTSGTENPQHDVAFVGYLTVGWRPGQTETPAPPP